MEQLSQPERWTSLACSQIPNNSLEKTPKIFILNYCKELRSCFDPVPREPFSGNPVKLRAWALQASEWSACALCTAQCVMDREALWSCTTDVWISSVPEILQTFKHSQWMEERSSRRVFTRPNWASKVGCENPSLQPTFLKIHRCNCSWNSARGCKESQFTSISSTEKGNQNNAGR